MTRLLCIAFLCALMTIDPAGARNIPWFSYDELFAKSDLVVIAVPATKTRDTTEHTALTKNITPAIPVVGVITDFQCLLVLKGAKRQRLTLHHYRDAPLPLKPGQGIESVVMNGPTFTTYKPAGVDHPYLMFLVREHDGRFTPVGGQIDPNISIQKIDRL